VPAPRFYAPNIESDQSSVRLPSDQAQHLVRVLRLRSGDAVRVFDGHGGEWHARVASAAGNDVTVDLLEPSTPAAEPPVRVALGVGLLKRAQMDDVIRDATMLGVSSIVPVVTAHIAVPATARDGAAVGERWRRIAVGSARQCGRAVVPDIAEVTPFETVLAAASTSTVTVMSVEPDRRAEHSPIPWPDAPPPSDALVLVGPEGGWAPEEVEAALRAETAPTVLLSVLWARWGW
jgi:16S rRNA (uracil1498-N3)-methyltransferase